MTRNSRLVSKLARELGISWEEASEAVLALKEDGKIGCRLAIARLRRWAELLRDMELAVDDEPATAE